MLGPRHSYDLHYRLRTCYAIPILIAIRRWLISATRASIQHSIHLRGNLHEPQYELITLLSDYARAAHLSHCIFPLPSIYCFAI